MTTVFYEKTGHCRCSAFESNPPLAEILVCSKTLTSWGGGRGAGGAVEAGNWWLIRQTEPPLVRRVITTQALRFQTRSMFLSLITRPGDIDLGGKGKGRELRFKPIRPRGWGRVGLRCLVFFLSLLINDIFKRKVLCACVQRPW